MIKQNQYGAAAVKTEAAFFNAGMRFPPFITCIPL